MIGDETVTRPTRAARRRTPPLKGQTTLARKAHRSPAAGIRDGSVRAMDHRFDGPRYTVGVEEELMILDSSSLDLVNAIDSILGDDPPSGKIQPELLESVLEIATAPCPTVPALADELASLRALARDRARREGLEIGSAGTHPFARWEDQRVVSDDRYRGLIQSLGFVARQELVFGMHVHVGLADPRRRSTSRTACASTCRC
jgi:hypothetical protein